MVIPCRNGLYMDVYGYYPDTRLMFQVWNSTSFWPQPLQRCHRTGQRQEGQVRTRQSLSDWYLEQDEQDACPSRHSSAVSFKHT